ADAGSQAAGKLSAELTSGGSRVAGPAAFDTSGVAMPWVLAPPWGRSLSLAVTGHRDKSIELFPWSDASFPASADLVPDPPLMVRLAPDIASFAAGERLEILFHGTVLAQATLAEGSGALLVGPGSRLDIPGRVPSWEHDIAEGELPDPAIRKMLLDLWRKPSRTGWERPPPSVFA